MQCQAARSSSSTTTNRFAMPCRDGLCARGLSGCRLCRWQCIPGDGAVAHAVLRTSRHTYTRTLRPRHSEGAQRAKLQRADHYHLRSGRHTDGGRRHQARGARLRRQAVRRQYGRRAVGNAIANWTKGKTKGGGTLILPHFPGHDLLTPREREVLEQIARGASNKEAGRLLGISPRTVEVHRARIMENLGAKNAADLVRIVLSEHRSR